MKTLSKKRHQLFSGAIELFLLRNMSWMILIIMIAIWGINIGGQIDIIYALTSTGALIGFWYGYKKYERDKEIELMDTYSRKYGHILESEGEVMYMKVIDLWYEEYFLHSRGYISRNLWIEWEHWIYEDFGDLLEYLIEQSKGQHDDIKKFFLSNPICTKLLDYSLYGASDINYFSGVKDSGTRKYVRRFRNNTIDPTDMSSYYSYSKVNGQNFFDFILQILSEHKSHTEHLIYTGKIMKRNERRKYLRMKDEFDESFQDLKDQLFLIEKLTEFLT